MYVKRIEMLWKERKKRQHQESKTKNNKTTNKWNECDFVACPPFFYTQLLCICLVWSQSMLFSHSTYKWLCFVLWTPVTRFYTKIIVRCTVYLSLSISFIFSFNLYIQTENAVIFWLFHSEQDNSLNKSFTFDFCILNET